MNRHAGKTRINVHFQKLAIALLLVAPLACADEVARHDSGVSDGFVREDASAAQNSVSMKASHDPPADRSNKKRVDRDIGQKDAGGRDESDGARNEQVVPNEKSAPDAEPRMIAVEYPQRRASIGIRAWRSGDHYLISMVAEGSGAAEKGISEGCVILEIDGVQVKGKPQDWVAKKLYRRTGRAMTVKYLQEGQEKSATLPVRPCNPCTLRYYWDVRPTASDVANLFSDGAIREVGECIAENRLLTARKLLQKLEFELNSVDAELSLLKLWLLCREADLCSWTTYQLKREFDEKSPYSEIIEQADLCQELNNESGPLIANILAESTLYWIKKRRAAGKSICRNVTSITSRTIDTNGLQGGPFVGLLSKAESMDYSFWRRWAATFKNESGAYWKSSDPVSGILLEFVFHFRMTGDMEVATAATSKLVLNRMETSKPAEMRILAEAYVYLMLSVYGRQGTSTIVGRDPLQQRIVARIRQTSPPLMVHVERHLGIVSKQRLTNPLAVMTMHANAFDGRQYEAFLGTLSKSTRLRIGKQLRNRARVKKQKKFDADWTTNYGRRMLLGGVKKAVSLHLANANEKKTFVAVDGRLFLCVSFDVFKNLPLHERFLVGESDRTSYVSSKNISRYFVPSHFGFKGNRYFVAAELEKQPDGTFVVRESVFLDMAVKAIEKIGR